MKSNPSNHAADGNDAGLSISATRGIRSYFDIDGITISVWASSWSGMEEVRVDGELVSRLRSLRRSSEHRFSHAGVDYRVEVTCVVFGSGTLRITLYRNGEAVDSDSGSAIGEDLVDGEGHIVWSRFLRKMAPIFIVSGLAGGVCGYLFARFIL